MASLAQVDEMYCAADPDYFLAAALKPALRQARQTMHEEHHSLVQAWARAVPVSGQKPLLLLHPGSCHLKKAGGNRGRFLRPGKSDGGPGVRTKPYAVCLLPAGGEMGS